MRRRAACCPGQKPRIPATADCSTLNLTALAPGPTPKQAQPTPTTHPVPLHRVARTLAPPTPHVPSHAHASPASALAPWATHRRRSVAHGPKSIHQNCDAWTERGVHLSAPLGNAPLLVLLRSAASWSCARGCRAWCT